jgi:hypothetical protein
VKKKFLFGIIFIIILIIAWYLISPAFKVVKLNEASPLEVNDNLNSMDSTTLTNFEEAMDIAASDSSTVFEMMPSEISKIKENDFTERAHEVEGKALIINDNDQNILRFEDFETINGPNLHVYLSTELGISDAVDLGELKANSGSFNYELEDIDIEKYNQVLVWCQPFKVLFSYADLS